MNARAIYLLIFAVVGGLGATSVRADVTLEATQPSFDFGDSCRFILTNDTPYILTFSSSNAVFEVYDEGDCLIWPSFGYPAEIEVSPQEVWTLAWDQTYDINDCGGEEGEQVSEGLYYARSHYVIEELSYEILELEVPFQILEDTPIRETTWARIKALFMDRAN